MQTAVTFLGVISETNFLNRISNADSTATPARLPVKYHTGLDPVFQYAIARTFYAHYGSRIAAGEEATFMDRTVRRVTVYFMDYSQDNSVIADIEFERNGRRHAA